MPRRGRVGRLDRSAAGGASGGDRAASPSPRTAKICRPGGHWPTRCTAPTASTTPTRHIYFEVEEHAKLVYDHGGNDDRPPLFRVTVLFSEVDGKTKMDMTMALPTPEAAEETRKFIKQAGGDSTWDRLAEYLEKESTGKEKFVINRTFDAPLEVMFEMWTDPEHFPRGWARPASRWRFIRLRHQARRRHVLFHDDGDGVKMYGRPSTWRLKSPIASSTRSSSATSTRRSPAIPWRPPGPKRC